MFQRKMKDDDGQVLVLTLCSMAVLMGFLALALDVGTLYNARRRVQTAADAAAIAAAVSYNYSTGTTSAVQTAAISAASTAAGNNGIAPANTPSANGTCSSTDLKSNCLEVFFGTGITNAYHNTSGYLEAVVSQPNPSFFVNALSALTGGNGIGTVPVTAKAVAGIVPSPACTHVTDKTDAGTLTVKGNADINSSTCGIQVDSTSNAAICIQGNGKIQAPYINVAGSQSSTGQCGKNSGSPVYPGSGQAGDPFNNLQGPNPAKDCTAANTLALSSYTSDPGKYSSVTASDGTTANVECFSNTGGVTISGTWGSSPSTNGDILVFEYGVTVGGTTTVNGTMDVASGNFTQGNSSLSINAPGSDNSPAAKALTYDSIAIMQPFTNTTACNPIDNSIRKALITSSEPCLQLQFGSGFGTLDGYVYAPTSAIYMQDQGGQVQVAGIVSYSMFINSDLKITSYDEQNASSTKLTSIELVE